MHGNGLNRLIIVLALVPTLVFLPSCPDGGKAIKGLRLSPPGPGPTVIFDPLDQPIPEIPFPNDVATVSDRTSPTGKRLNVRIFAPTRSSSFTRFLKNWSLGF